jgi:hypothetical protein
MGYLKIILGGILPGIALFLLIIKYKWWLKFFRKPKKVVAQPVVTMERNVRNPVPEPVATPVAAIPDARDLSIRKLEEEKGTLLKANEDLLKQKKRMEEHTNDLMRTRSELEKAYEQSQEVTGNLMEMKSGLEDENSMLKERNNELKNLLEDKAKTDTRSFQVEALLTAGPRKDAVRSEPNDEDLGEDGCGFLIKGDRLFFWLLDGTGGEDIIRYEQKQLFSSRILTQYISSNLAYIVRTEPDIRDVSAWCRKAYDLVASDWIEKAKEKQSHLVAVRETGTVMTFKTVLVAGIWEKQSGTLNIIRKGDACLLAFDAKGREIVHPIGQKPASRSNVALQMKLTDYKGVEVIPWPIDKNMETAALKEVQTLFLYSDGISGRTEEYIRSKMRANDLNEKYLDFRKGFTEISQDTKDDKSMIVAQIV